MAGDGSSAPGGCVVLRYQRDQRARYFGAGAGADVVETVSEVGRGAWCGAVGGVWSGHGGVAGAGGAAPSYVQERPELEPAVVAVRWSGRGRRWSSARWWSAGTGRSCWTGSPLWPPVSTRLIEDTATGTGTGVVFVFPGQGSQWLGMAAGLLESSPVFAARMAECEQALSVVDWSLTAVLRGATRPRWGAGGCGAAGAVGGDGVPGGGVAVEGVSLLLCGSFAG